MVDPPFFGSNSAIPTQPHVESASSGHSGPLHSRPSNAALCAAANVQERPRLTLHLPSLSSANLTTSSQRQSQPKRQYKTQGSSQPQPQVHASSLSASLPGTRPCRRVGCSSILALSHPWIFCHDCLHSTAPKVLSASDELSPDNRRRASESNVATQSEGTDEVRQRRVSESSVMLTQDHAKSVPPSTKLRIPPHPRAGHPIRNSSFTLPTPPPSSRQSSPFAHGHDPLSVPSLSEIPLASTFTSLAPDAPRYAKRSSRSNIWKSELSDLMPLTSSASSDVSDADSSDDQNHAGGAKDSGSGLKIRIGFAHKSFVCVRTKCHNLLMPWSKWKMCHTCRLRFRDRSRERHNDERLFARSKYKHNSAAIEVDVEGADSGRTCAIRWCRTALPPVDHYKWKLCEACRIRTRRQSRKRRSGDVGLASDEDGEGELSLARLAEHKRVQAAGFKKLRLTFRGETVASVGARKRAREAASVVRLSFMRITSIVADALGVDCTGQCHTLPSVPNFRPAS
jgi:hypothetical protein